MKHLELTAAAARKRLRLAADPEKVPILQRFFRTGKGEYGEGDIFLGLKVPETRAIAKQFEGMSDTEIVKLLRTKIHEERLMALILLVDRFARSTPDVQERTYRLFLKEREWVNNWDLVDTSAPRIVGGYLLKKRDRKVLRKLARSKDLWDRRIAIVATQWLIKHGELDDTFAISEMLLKDKEDLMHKATGWMLREAGKKDVRRLEKFLERYASTMPRTMLRYALEKFSPAKRSVYMAMKSSARKRH